jgi:hypothetical protein
MWLSPSYRFGFNKEIYSNTKYLSMKQQVQAALVICGLFIYEFAYSHLQKWSKMTIFQPKKCSFYLRIQDLRSKTYLPRITRETCSLNRFNNFKYVRLSTNSAKNFRNEHALLDRKASVSSNPQSQTKILDFKKKKNPNHIMIYQFYLYSEFHRFRSQVARRLFSSQL